MARGLEWGTSVYRVVVRVWNRYGNMYLDMDVAIESEVADTTGSTATMGGLAASASSRGLGGMGHGCEV